jgi:hypothetical protein
MKRIAPFLVAFIVCLTIPATTLADDAPPIITPSSVTTISSADQGVSGIMVPSADSLKPPKRQVLTYGGCAIDVSWHTVSGLMKFDAVPYGSCRTRHLQSTMAWSFVPWKKSSPLAYDLHGIGLHVFSLTQKLRVRVTYSTIRGRAVACAFVMSKLRGLHTCR